MAKRIGLLSAATAAVGLAVFLAGPSFGGPPDAPRGNVHSGGSSGSGDSASKDKKPEDKPKSVLELIEGDKAYPKFTAALQSTGLEASLKGAGPFTVLVPSDVAFLSIDHEKLWALMQDKAKFKLTIQGHILATKATAADIAKMPKVIGQGYVSHEVKVGDDKVMKIDGAKIETADVVASNGFLQIIDKVLIPEDKPVAKPAEKPADPSTDKPADKPSDK